MIIRELEKRDGPEVLKFLLSEFPEEEAILGTRPEGFADVLRRAFRWDARLVLGFLRLVGRPIIVFYIAEEDARVVGTTALSFQGPTGYLSMVVVDPAYRRRGFAQALLERSRSMSARLGKRYVALDVLAKNAPARALYERAGYRSLRVQSFLVHDDASAFPKLPPPPELRPFRPSDAKPLAEIARRANPAEVERVLPTDDRMIRGSRFASSVMAAETATWVVDRGQGPEAWIRAVVSRATEAGHLAAPIVGEGVAPDLALALVSTAGAWCANRGIRRLACQVPEENRRGRAALEGGGFHEAFQSYTLYRPVA